MKKSIVIALAVQAVVLFALPGVVQPVGRGDVHFILTLMILMVIHPLCCLGTGIFAGLDIKTRWWLVVSGPTLALCADLIFYAMDADFMFYAGINLLLGALGMTATAVVRWAMKRKA